MSIESLVRAERWPVVRTGFAALVDEVDRVAVELLATVFTDESADVPVGERAVGLFAAADAFVTGLRADAATLVEHGNVRVAADVLVVCERIRRGVEATMADTGDGCR